jgi:hypothetical protein
MVETLLPPITDVIEIGGEARKDEPIFEAMDERVTPPDVINPFSRLTGINNGQIETFKYKGASISDVTEVLREGGTGFDVAATLANKRFDPLDPQFNPEVFAQEQLAQAILDDPNADPFTKRQIEIGNVGWIGNDIRFQNNSRILNEEIASKIAEVRSEGRTWFGYAHEAIDHGLVRRLLMGVWEDVSGVDERMGEENVSDMVSMDPDKYRTKIRSTLDGLASEGVLNWAGGTNVEALERRAMALGNLGIDPNKEVTRFGAILEIALEATPAGFLGPIARGLGRVGVRQLPTQSLGTVTQPTIIGQNIAKARVRVKARTSRTPIRDTERALTKEIAEAVHNGSNDIPDITAVDTLDPVSVSTQLDPLNPNASVVASQRVKSNLVARINANLPQITLNKELSKVANNLRNNFEWAVGSHILRETITPRTKDLFTYSFDYGTGTGRAFMDTPGNVTKLNNQARAFNKEFNKQGFVANVVPGDDGGLVVRVMKDIKEKEILEVADDWTPNSGNGTLSPAIAGAFRWFRSAPALEGELATIRSQRESALSKVAAEITDEFNAVSAKLSRKDRGQVDSVIETDVWGVDYKMPVGKEWPTEAQINATFRSKFNRNMTDTELEYYNVNREYSNTSWFLDGSVQLKKMVEKGFLKLSTSKDELDYLGRAVDEVPAGSRVWDMSRATRDSRPWLGKGRKTQVYQLDDPIMVKGETVRYVANPENTNIPLIEDVFGYNAGPAKTQQFGRFFITVGRGAGMRDASILTAMSRKEAANAVDSLKELMAARTAGILTDDMVRGNKFHPDVQTVEGFDKFVQDSQLYTGDISFKRKDAKLSGLTVDDIWAGASMEEYFAAKKRGQVLPTVAGGTTRNIDFHTAMQEQLGRALHRYTFNATTIKAETNFAEQLNDYMKMPGTDVRGIDNIRPWDYTALATNAEIKGNDYIANKLRDLQRAILNRRPMSSPMDIQAYGDSTLEFIYDSKLPFAKKIGSTQLRGGDQLEQFMLGYNFHTSLGLMNMSQLVVQGFGALVAAAISPRYGMSAVGGQLLFHSMSYTGRPAVRQGIAKILETISLGTTRPISAETWLLAHESWMRSGRKFINGTTMEMGTPAGLGFGSRGLARDAQRIAGRVADKAAFAFNKGEQMARSASHIIAVAEYRSKFPKADIFSDEAARFIASREQVLTLNMNAASKAQFQRGIFRIPAQWSSWMIRSAEAVTTGGRMGLTPVERSRLGLFLILGTGMGPLGLDGAAQDINEWMGEEPDSTFYRNLSGGIVDGIMNTAGVPLGVTDRLSWWKGVKDFYENLTDGNLLTAAAGPTEGVLGKDFVRIFDVWSRDTVSWDKALVETLRIAPGVDNAAKAYGIMQNGYITSAKGKQTPISERNNNYMVAAMQMLGVKTFEAQAMSRVLDDYYDHRADLKAYRTRFAEDYRTVRALINEGRMEEAFTIMERVHADIATIPNLSVREANSLRSGIFRAHKDQTSMIYDYLKRDPTQLETFSTQRGN